jgi:2-polyprenyl-6-methoxyphenol hydroxylase-like FAD-dependent oxidoreductase
LRAHLKHRFDLEPEFGTSLLSFEEYTEHLTAHLEYGVIGSEQPTRQDVQVSYIIGADGGKSGVRKSLGLPFEGVTLPGLMLYGDVHVEGIDQNTWHVWGDTSSLLFVQFYLSPSVPRRSYTFRVAFWPIGANSDEAMAFRCFGAQLSDERAAELTQDTDALARLVTDHVGLPEVKLGKWASLTSFRTNVRMVPSFSSPGLRSFLAGDAAHTHSPAGGQGLNSSVQDAANLGWKLALVLHGHADRTLLASYSAERVPVIRAMLIQTTAELKRTGTWAAKQDVQSTPPDFTQLGVKYAGSSLVFDQLGEQISPPNPSEVIERRPSPAVRGDQLRAGNRAPDAPRLLVLSGEEEGLEITLFDIFDLTAHTIIIFSAPEASVTAIAETLSTLQLARSMGLVRIVVLLSSRSGAEETLKNDVDRVLLDSASHAFSAYAPARLGSLAVFIIRPDQIIGAITSNAEGSRRYLCSIFTLSSP